MGGGLASSVEELMLSIALNSHQPEPDTGWKGGVPPSGSTKGGRGHIAEPVLVGRVTRKRVLLRGGGKGWGIHADPGQVLTGPIPFADENTAVGKAHGRGGPVRGEGGVAEGGVRGLDAQGHPEPFPDGMIPVEVGLAELPGNGRDRGEDQQGGLKDRCRHLRLGAFWWPPSLLLIHKVSRSRGPQDDGFQVGLCGNPLGQDPVWGGPRGWPRAGVGSYDCPRTTLTRWYP